MYTCAPAKDLSSAGNVRLEFLIDRSLTILAALELDEAVPLVVERNHDVVSFLFRSEGGCNTDKLSALGDRCRIRSVSATSQDVSSTLLSILDVGQCSRS